LKRDFSRSEFSDVGDKNQTLNVSWI
jgi:hypothetical protein